MARSLAIAAGGPWSQGSLARLPGAAPQLGRPVLAVPRRADLEGGRANARRGIAAGAAAAAVARRAATSGSAKDRRVARALELIEELRDLPKPSEAPAPRASPSPLQQVSGGSQPSSPLQQAASGSQAPDWLQAPAEVVGQRSAESEEPAVSSAGKANFSRIYAQEEWGSEARSGLGSREDTTREFRQFFEGFLREHQIASVVDAGCGHWPTGYQRFMDWQGVHYVGVDVVPYVVEENRAFFQDPANLQAHGLASADCMSGDVSSDLPSGDLLLVKDVLMHLPNSAVHSFLRQHLDPVSPKYRAVLLVQNAMPASMSIRQMMDIEPGQLLPFDITSPPFEAPFRTVFSWQSDEPKVAQLWEPR